MDDYYNQFVCQKCNQFSIIIENDGRVCYGYLLFSERIIGDVWLYNQGETPKIADWSRKEDLPFLNSSEFAKDSDDVIMISKGNDVAVEWIFADDNCRLDQAEIYIKGQLAAILKENSKPGWSTNAKKDGPLANSL